MIELREKGSEALIGEISGSQLQFLVDQLEEEHLEDQDYAITPMLLEVFEAEGGDEALISLLRKALGDRDTMEIAWAKAA